MVIAVSPPPLNDYANNATKNYKKIIDLGPYKGVRGVMIRRQHKSKEESSLKSWKISYVYGPLLLHLFIMGLVLVNKHLSDSP